MTTHDDWTDRLARFYAGTLPFSMGGDWYLLVTGTTADDMARLLRWYDQPDEIRPDPEESLMTFSVHSWVIEIGGQTILIDSCCGNHKDRLLPEVHQLDTRYLENLRLGVSASGHQGKPRD